jgi:hypothetical protein
MTGAMTRAMGNGATVRVMRGGVAMGVTEDGSVNGGWRWGRPWWHEVIFLNFYNSFSIEKNDVV